VATCVQTGISKLFSKEYSLARIVVQERNLDSFGRSLACLAAQTHKIILFLFLWPKGRASASILYDFANPS
jgi:hypothetical protein